MNQSRYILPIFQDKFDQLDDGAVADLDAKIAELSKRHEELTSKYRSLAQGE